jgi:hypothetical protein
MILQGSDEMNSRAAFLRPLGECLKLGHNRFFPALSNALFTNPNI